MRTQYEKHLRAVKQALDAGTTVSDILWVAGRLGLSDQIVQFANGCADAAARAARLVAADDVVRAVRAARWAAYSDAACAAAAHAVYAAARTAAHAARWADADRADADAAHAAEIERQKAHLLELFGETE